MVSYKQPRFYMMVGLPGVGKDTWLDNHPMPDCVLCSSDDFIEAWARKYSMTYNQAFLEMAGDAADDCYDKFLDAIYDEKSVILNRTNLTKKTRKRWMDVVPKNYRKTAIYIPAPPQEEHLRRLISRPGKVIPEKVLLSMQSSMEHPELSEGFDSIINV